MFDYHIKDYIKRKYQILILNNYKNFLFDFCLIISALEILFFIYWLIFLIFSAFKYELFLSFKNNYYLVEKSMQLNINHINKTDFLAAYYKACIKIFKSENILYLQLQN